MATCSEAAAGKLAFETALLTLPPLPTDQERIQDREEQADSGEGLAKNANPTLVLWFSTGTHSRTYRVRTVRRSPDVDSAQVEAFFNF